jgi:hypothetical protein
LASSDPARARCGLIASALRLSIVPKASVIPTQSQLATLHRNRQFPEEHRCRSRPSPRRQSRRSEHALLPVPRFAPQRHHA